jgi:hypothetical protein
MIGVYQRPAPPKRPLGLNVAKTIQKPAIPLHEIEAQANAVMDDVLATARKRGRPAINEQAMTPAERQARRRALQLRERAIQEVREIGDAHGKSHAEANTGGYDASKLEMMYFLGGENDDGVERGRAGRVTADGESNTAHEQSTDEILNCGESSFHHYGRFEAHQVQEVRVRGLRIGDEESNRRLFAEDTLGRMVGEYFDVEVTGKTFSLIRRHIGNNTSAREALETTYRCKLCADAMQLFSEAKDHLRVDHRKIIDEFFKKLQPSREFRDMGSYVTIVMPRQHKKSFN